MDRLVATTAAAAAAKATTTTIRTVLATTTSRKSPYSFSIRLGNKEKAIVISNFKRITGVPTKDFSFSKEDEDEDEDEYKDEYKDEDDRRKGIEGQQSLFLPNGRGLNVPAGPARLGFAAAAVATSRANGPCNIAEQGCCCVSALTRSFGPDTEIERELC
ncbi:hypothetical protein V1477_018255 [Vespula maculifrons]|uniref:Uncharacterized protein n=1 Tax=Vespula maculifrons TaxID=7453 RepID=A0ABD2AYX8_VESMC